MKPYTPPSDLTRFAHFVPRQAARRVIWSIFHAFEDDEACHVQGAMMYDSVAGVLPYKLSQKKRGGK